MKHNIVNYMHLHSVMMLAYAKAGIKKLPSAPAEEPRGSDPCLYVECPYDVVRKYHQRLQARVNRLAELGQPSLEWVANRDRAEREIWVREMRNGSKSLGTIISQTFQMRESLWQIDEDAIKDKMRAKHNQPPPQQQKKGGGRQGQERQRSPRGQRSPSRGRGGKDRGKGRGGEGRR